MARANENCARGLGGGRVVAVVVVLSAGTAVATTVAWASTFVIGVWTGVGVMALGVAMVGVVESSGIGGARAGSASSSFRLFAVTDVVGGFFGMRQGFAMVAVAVLWEDPVLFCCGVRRGAAARSDGGAACVGRVLGVGCMGHDLGCW